MRSITKYMAYLLCYQYQSLIMMNMKQQLHTRESRDSRWERTRIYLQSKALYLFIDCVFIYTLYGSLSGSTRTVQVLVQYST